MSRFIFTALIFLLFQTLIVNSQSDDENIMGTSGNADNGILMQLPSKAQIDSVLYSLPRLPKQKILGGYTGSIYREAIDSVMVILFIDGERQDTVFSEKGIYSFTSDKKGKLIDLFFFHPDYHSRDTSMIFPDSEISNIHVEMSPKYKILLRGRAYAGDMPMEGVDVIIKHLDHQYRMTTLGCYYDTENYWNCLFDGMFKYEIIAETPQDSIQIILLKDGMKTYEHHMTFSEYQGEIMQFRLKYATILPKVPSNTINLKLSFPFSSFDDSWFVGISYYRTVSNLKRLGYGIEADMYITNVSVSHETFNELEPSVADSSYFRTFAGPSLLYWFIKPEQRYFSSYAGCTFSVDLTDPALVPQYFLGSRIFLDLNKAISLELRYTDYEMNIVHYQFNPFGNAHSYYENEKLLKLHATVGVQVIF